MQNTQPWIASAPMHAASVLLLIPLIALPAAAQSGRQFGFHTEQPPALANPLTPPAPTAPYGSMRKRTLPTGKIQKPRIAIGASCGNLPLSFEPNAGQTDARVKFISRGAGYSLVLTPREAVFTLSRPGGTAAPHPVNGTGGWRALDAPSHHLITPSPHPSLTASRATLRMQLTGIQSSVRLTGEGTLPGTSSYFIGSDPNKWRTGIKTYRKVRYAGVYPGVDLLYYGNQRQLEYDFLVAPRADPSRISFKFVGTKRVSIDKMGELAIDLDGGSLRWRKPVVYQDINGRHKAVNGRFVLRANRQVGFALATYDKSLPLIIDPVLAYSTYLGGTGPDMGEAIAVDRYGSMFITGETFSDDFPATTGVRHSLPSVFVTRLDRSGSRVLYSTILGGTEASFAHGIKVDAAGNAYVAGTTQSADFPVNHGLQVSNQNGFAAFLVVLNTAGTGLRYGTLFGGSDQSVTQASGLDIDGAGHAWITGQTNSNNLPTLNAFQPSNAPQNLAGFLAKLDVERSGDDSLLSSTYFGAAGVVAPRGVAVDAYGNAAICGTTTSASLPTTQNAFQPTAPPASMGGTYSFVTKFNAAGSSLLYSTYLSSQRTDSLGDFATAITVDAWGFIYVTGHTYEKQFPIALPALQNTAPGGPAVGFVSALDPRLSGRSSLVMSTYLGGSAGHPSPAADPTGGSTPAGFDPLLSGVFLSDGHIGETLPTGIAVDAAGNVYVVGTTTIVNAAGGPSANYFYGFVEKIRSHNRRIPVLELFSALFGNGLQVVAAARAIAVDPTGAAYITGGSDGGLATTAGAFQPIGPGGGDAFAVKLVSRVPPHDLNQDGTTDLVFQDQKTSLLTQWFMKGTTETVIRSNGPFPDVVGSQPGADWMVQGLAEFLGDHRDLLAMQNRASGDIVIWDAAGSVWNYILNDIAGASPGSLDAIPNPGAGWQIAGIGDFNADGHPDILLQRGAGGDLYLWYTGLYLANQKFGDNQLVTLKFGAPVAPGNPGPGWQVAAVADLDGDGKPDILFQNTATGDLYVWYMDGNFLRHGEYLSPINPGAGWRLAGTADLNQDGHPDLIFQNKQTGMLAYWLMLGSREFKIGLFSPTGSGSPDQKLVAPK